MTVIWKFVSATFLIFAFSTASDACVNQEGKLADSENVVLKLAHVIREQFANKSIAEDVAARAARTPAARRRRVSGWASRRAARARTGNGGAA